MITQGLVYLTYIRWVWGKNGLECQFDQVSMYTENRCLNFKNTFTNKDFRVGAVVIIVSIYAGKSTNNKACTLVGRLGFRKNFGQVPDLASFERITTFWQVMSLGWSMFRHFDERKRAMARHRKMRNARNQILRVSRRKKLNHEFINGSKFQSNGEPYFRF